LAHDNGESVKQFSADAPFADVALGAIEPLWVLLPSGWKQARAEFEVAGEGIRVKSVAPTLVDAMAEQRPDLGLNHGVWSACLARGFMHLRTELGEHGVSWDGSAVDVEKEDLTRALLTFSNADGQVTCTVPLSKPVMRGQVLTDETLGIIVDRSTRFAKMQQSVAALAATLKSWEFEADTQTLVFKLADGDVKRIPAQVLGSYSGDEGTFLWSWANKSYKPADHEKVLALREQSLNWLGAGALWRPGFFSDERFAGLVTMIAASEMGATGVFPPRMGGALRIYYALFTEGQTPPV